MIAPLSFLAAFDKPQAKPVSGEAEASEGAENQGNDGFAALIAQLVQIVPAAGEPEAERVPPADDETEKLPTGKILPEDGRDLAAARPEQAVGQAIHAGSALPASSAVTTSSATILSFQQAQTALAGMRMEPTPRPEVQAGPPQAVSKEGTGVQVTPGPDQIRMTLAVAQPSAVQAKEGTGAQATPRGEQTRMPVLLAAVEGAPIRAAGLQDKSAPVERQLLQSSAMQSGDPKQSRRDPQAPASTVAERGQSTRVAATDKDIGSVERSTQGAAVETASGAARTSGLAENAKPLAAFVSETLAATKVEGARISAAVPNSAMTSVEGIERLVERLSVAREFDITKSASIAVTHREFGALTMTFDNARNGLDVEIVAKDADMQRALSLAVSADRANSRSPEPLQQAFQQASQGPQAGSERGAGSTGQGATSSGAQSSESGTQGDRSREHGERGSASASEDIGNSVRPSPRDASLYA